MEGPLEVPLNVPLEAPLAKEIRLLAKALTPVETFEDKEKRLAVEAREAAEAQERLVLRQLLREDGKKYNLTWDAIDKFRRLRLGV